MKAIRCILSLTALFFTVAVHAQNWTSGLNSGGPATQNSTDVSEEISGSKALVGTYTRGPAVFGSRTLNWSTGSSDPFNTTPNGFIVRYSTYNNVLWATRIASSAGATISSVTTDGGGNIYVCGSYVYICEFYNAANPNAASPVATLPHAPGPGPGPSRGFVAKYSSTGTLIWAKRGLGDSEVITDIAVSEDNSQLVVTGRVHNPALGNNITYGSYVLWLDPSNGNTIRAYNYSNDWNYTLKNKTGLCIDHSNNVIVSGTLTTPSYSVSGANGGIPVTTNGVPATLYAKYSSTGAVLWARATMSTISSPRSKPSSLAVDRDNNIYIAGWAGSGASNYDLQFASSPTTYASIPIPTSVTNNGYIVKLNSANGYALWKSYARNTTPGIETISLASGKCNFIYACINTAANPTYTDASNTVISPAISSEGLAVFALKTNGQLLTTTPWIINGTSTRAHITSRDKNTLQCVTSAATNVTLQTSSGPLTLSPASGSSDVILGTITYSGPAPTVTLPASIEVCEGATIPLTASATGTSPFTYSWSIYNPTTGYYVPLGTSVAPPYSVSSSVYTPYIMTLFSARFVSIQVTVTDCSGLTASRTIGVILKQGIIYSQVSGVDVCYKPQIGAPNAVFSVNAQNVDTYYWQYSSSAGMSWSPCTGIDYSGGNTPTLTVINPTASQNYYLFRCRLGGCPTIQATNPAVLTVTPCPLRPADDKEVTIPDTKLTLYPNPVSTTLEAVFKDGTSPDTQTPVEAYILDMTGRKVRDIPFGKGHYTLEVSGLHNGTYSFVVLTNGKVIDQQKFIVMH
ncbi:Beta-propeller repeat protein [compost metagenome]